MSDDSPNGVWKATSLRTLKPGMDFVDGLLYLTVPISRTIMRKRGKGANAIEEPHIERGAAAITSDRQYFLFDRLNLHERHFAYPDTVAIDPGGWSGNAMQSWVDGEAEAPDAFDLYQRIRALYTTYIEFADEMHYDLMTMYVIATYLFKVFDTFPYLHFGGTKDSGKSQNLRILKVIAFNASLSGNMTAADLFRSSAGNPGLMGIDETETFKGERGDALKEVLNMGYKKGGVVGRQRQMPDGTFTPDRFDVYGPKALASITPLTGATATRAIEITMRPALRQIPHFEDDPAKWAHLRDDLYYFALTNAALVHAAYLKWNDPTFRTTKAPGLFNRAWEVSAPLIVMADFIAGDTLSEPLIEWLVAYFADQRKRDDSTDYIRTLVLSLPSVLKDNVAHEGWYYPLSQVLSTFKSFTDEDATEKVSTRSITKWLTPLGFTEVRTRKGGKQVRITEDDLRAVFRNRRIEPHPEDTAWLAAERSYQSEDRVATPEAQQDELDF